MLFFLCFSLCQRACRNALLKKQPAHSGRHSADGLELLLRSNIPALNFADKVQAGLKCFFAGLPARRTNLPFMSSYVNGCLKFPQKLFDVSANAVIVNLKRLENSVRVDDESSS